MKKNSVSYGGLEMKFPLQKKKLLYKEVCVADDQTSVCVETATEIRGASSRKHKL